MEKLAFFWGEEFGPVLLSKYTLIEDYFLKKTENFQILKRLVSEIVCLVCTHILTHRFFAGPHAAKLCARTGLWVAFLENMDAGVSNAVFHVFARQRPASVAQFEF